MPESQNPVLHRVFAAIISIAAAFVAGLAGVSLRMLARYRPTVAPKALTSSPRTTASAARSAPHLP